MRKCNWIIQGQQSFGYFHQFGTNFGCNQDGNAVNYTDAIVEDKDGNVLFVPVDSIQFVPDDFCRKEYDEHKNVFGF